MPSIFKRSMSNLHSSDSVTTLILSNVNSFLWGNTWQNKPLSHKLETAHNEYGLETLLFLVSNFYFKLESISSLEGQKPTFEITQGPQCQPYYSRFCFLKKTLKQPRNHNTLSVIVSNTALLWLTHFCLSPQGVTE